MDRKYLLEAMGDALTSLHKEAKGGDVGACKALIDYGHMYTEVESSNKMEDQANIILNQALAGKISTSTADKLMALLEKKVSMVEVSELARKIEELESDSNPS